MGTRLTATRHRPKPLRLAAALLATALLAACASAPPSPPAQQDSPPAKRLAYADGDVIAHNGRFVVYQPVAGDSFESIAERFLGARSEWWRIADFNQLRAPKPGQILVVPVLDPNPVRVLGDRFQTVPVLCYHRFGSGKSKMIVSAESFAAQLEWLARNDYRVIPLADLVDFLDGRKAVPERAVVITIDDGYKSVYQHAFPLLKKYGFPATVFLYSDFVGAGDALTWQQMGEMVASGLIDIQAHSKSHANLLDRQKGESDAEYMARIEAEIAVPREVIQTRLPVKVAHFAFPYGDANQQVIDALGKHRYALGLTVNPGANAFFAQPTMLRRTMIYGDHNLDAFKARLQVSRPISNP